MSKYTEELSLVHDYNKTTYEKDTNFNREVMLEAATAELMFCEGLINDFFLRTEEGSNIKAIYEKVADSTFTESVNMIDTANSSKMYGSYNQGVMRFVNDAKEDSMMTESENPSKLITEATLEKAGNANSIFMESIFGGDKNPTKTVTVQDGMVTLERMVDFVNEINVLKENVNEVSNISYGCSADDKVMNESVRIFTEAVSEYTYHTMETMLDTYENIRHLVLDEKPAAKTFKMF